MRIQKVWKEDIARLTKREKSEFKALVTAIREHRDLAARLDLIYSVSGAGLPTAVTVLVRLPEIGQLTREQVAALAGLAPYDDDSGEQVGVRHIDGGRQRLRRALYTAALPASFRWNPQLIALYNRLIAAGKGHKRALIACARKLLIFVNTVVARGAPVAKSATAARHNDLSFFVRLQYRFFVPTCRRDDVARSGCQGWPSLRLASYPLPQGHALTAASTTSSSQAVGCRFNGCYEIYDFIPA